MAALDINNDGRLDRDEPQNTTTTEGQFILESSVDYVGQAQDASRDPPFRAKLTLLPGRSCLDGQTGVSPLTSMFVWLPDDLISPLTTMEAVMEENGMSAAAAKTSVDQTYDIDPRFDFLSASTELQCGCCCDAKTNVNLADAQLSSNANLVGAALRPSSRGSTSTSTRGMTSTRGTTSVAESRSA